MRLKPTTTKRLLLASSGLVALYFLTHKNVPPIVEKALNSVRDLSLPRGLRNFNPLNLRRGVAWAGRAGDDGAFDIFQTMEYGLRAAFQNMRTQHKRGFNTVAKLVAKWAPASDGNNTAKYIAFVCKTAPISANEIINIKDPETVAGILYAMAQMENGPDITKQKLSRATVLSVVKQNV